MHLIGGYGTVYASSTITGMLSDFFLSAILACVLYHSLLELRGAEAFRRLVELPTHSDGVRHKPINVAYFIDIAQGVGVFPITFGLWMLLANGIVNRSEFYSAVYNLMGSAGIRSMVENILHRVRTLTILDELQQKAGGDLEAKLRRRNIVREKARKLIFDMARILIIDVFALFSLL